MRTPAICRVFYWCGIDLFIANAANCFAANGIRERAFGHRASVAKHAVFAAPMGVGVITRDPWSIRSDRER